MVWKYLFGLALIGHGMGHLVGVGAALGVTQGFSDRPWIFGKATVTSQVGKLWSVIWLLAAGLLVTAGVGLMLAADWWPTLAVAGAVASIVAVVPWWNTVVPGARAGVAFDVLILIALLGPWREEVLQFLS